MGRRRRTRNGSGSEEIRRGLETGRISLISRYLEFKEQKWEDFDSKYI